jgi:hypothetical protein
MCGSYFLFFLLKIAFFLNAAILKKKMFQVYERKLGAGFDINSLF